MRVSNRPILALAAATILSACGADDAMLIAEILRGQPNPPDNTSTPPEPEQPAPGTEPAPDPVSEEQRAVQAILDVNCSNCHREAVGFGGMSTTDIDELVTEGLIVPGDSADSSIVIAMEQQRMPPPAIIDQRPTPRDIRRVARFIDDEL